MPVVSVGEAGFARLVGRSGAVVSVDGARVHLLGDHAPQPASPAHAPLSLLDAATEAATEAATDANAATAAVAAGAGEATAAAEAHTGEAHTGVAYAGLRLSGADQAMLDGAHGRAAQVAMRIVARVASLQHATELVDISQARIGGGIQPYPEPYR